MQDSKMCTVRGAFRTKKGTADVKTKKGTANVICNAEVRLQVKRDKGGWSAVEGVTSHTDSLGRHEIKFLPAEDATYRLESTAFGQPFFSDEFGPTPGELHNRDIIADLDFSIVPKSYDENGAIVDAPTRFANKRFLVRLEAPRASEREIKEFYWRASRDATVTQLKTKSEADIVAMNAGELAIGLTLIDQKDARLNIELEDVIADPDVHMIGGKLNVRLERTATPPTLDEAFWHGIRRHADAISFERYREFIDRVMCAGYDFHAPMGNKVLDPELRKVRDARHGVQAYELLKLATQVFLLLHCGVKAERDRSFAYAPYDSVLQRLDEYLGCPPLLPYIKRVISDAFPWLERDGWRYDCVLMGVHDPCLIELIKEYFLEEGMLMQTMNAITMRFQNVHAAGDRDPLANFEIDPLRPLHNILWGRTQDLHLLSVRRRAYEYMHEYGLALYGKATTSMRPADNRSKFLEAFNNLLYLCSVFFKEDNDTTVIADGYPLLNALKEVHLVLAQGAHNQFGDLPWTARAETLVAQWILAQPEARAFLQSRAMVPYAEPWMPQVDTMKTLQGWSDVTVSNFRDLAEFGERIVLSIRFGDWIAYVGEDHAKNWARFFRADIQAYLHAYRAITGVDLTNPDTVDATLPAIHLQRRLALQQVAH
jgi:hypothetical protein